MLNGVPARPVSCASTRTWPAISPAVRWRARPILPVRQNAQPSRSRPASRCRTSAPACRGCRRLRCAGRRRGAAGTSSSRRRTSGARRSTGVLDRERRGQLFAQRLAEVGHRGEVGDAAPVDPVEDLPAVEARRAEVREGLLELLALEIRQGPFSCLAPAAGCGNTCPEFCAIIVVLTLAAKVKPVNNLELCVPDRPPARVSRWSLKKRCRPGLRLVTESMPHVRSVTVGVWLTRGSRHESGRRERRRALRRAHALQGHDDAVGAARSRRRSTRSAASSTRSPPRNTPATTSRSSTSTCRVAIDLLSDMLLRPALAPGGRAEGAERHPRRNQDGRGRARRSGPRGVRAAVLVEASARPADSRARPKRCRRSTPMGCGGTSAGRYVAPHLVIAAAGQPRARGAARR